MLFWSCVYVLGHASGIYFGTRYCEMLAMTQETIPSIREAPVAKSISVNKKQISVEEIAESFEFIGEDIAQIGKLNVEERLLVEHFLVTLKKHMAPLTSSIAVSTSVLPFGLGVVTQAQLDPTGHLTLTLEYAEQEVLDLREPKNRDIMMAVIGDFMPKFQDLISQTEAEKLQRLSVQAASQVQEIMVPQLPTFEPPPTINVEVPLGLPDLSSIEVQEETPKPPEVVDLPVAPDLSVERNLQIDAIAEETLQNLELLGNEVFEQSPVSKYFDDWMVNLRQVILSFESSDVIGPDETFVKEYNQVFGEIEDELSKRLLNEAETEVSARTLVENRYLLGQIDAGYAAQTKELVLKGKSSIDHLIRNVQLLEAELAEVDQIKTSYLHPLKKLAKEQKQAELTQKLNASKKRLALAVGNSSVDKGKVGDIDAEYASQSMELAEKRKNAIDFLSKNVADLEEELAEIKKIKTSNLNFLKKVAQEQKQLEIIQRLNYAKQRLRLAEQNSGYEQEKLNEEYEKKKKVMMGKMQNLEKQIATNAVDDSSEARQAASNALAKAVKSLIERKKAPTNNNPLLPNGDEPTSATKK